MALRLIAANGPRGDTFAGDVYPGGLFAGYLDNGLKIASYDGQGKFGCEVVTLDLLQFSASHICTLLCGLAWTEYFSQYVQGKIHAALSRKSILPLGTMTWIIPGMSWLWLCLLWQIVCRLLSQAIYRPELCSLSPTVNQGSEKFAIWR